jgi:hypothetical protein
MSQVVATGGTVTDIVDGGVEYRVHEFTTSDDFVVSQGGEVEYLVVAGGGGSGGVGTGAASGGGGAGGLLAGTTNVSVGTIAVVVGAGGAAGAVGNSTGGNGGNSSIASVATAVGGGASDRVTPFVGRSGGSGGGGSNAAAGGLGTVGQGNDGGSSFSNPTGGGGGGAGASGSNAAAGVSGTGGTGVQSLITGTATFYAGGGGGGLRATTGTPGAGGSGGGGNGGLDAIGVAGTNGLGGGAGGSAGGAVTRVGAAGGSGVVIIRYVLFPPPFVYTPDPAVTIGGVNFTGNTIGQITIRRGRDSVYVEPSASYASVNLISVGSRLPLQIGKRLTVTLNDSNDNRQTLFSGRISDIDVQVTRASSDVAGYRLTAVGPLAGANRRQVLAAGRAEELDGERALAAIIGALGATFEEQPLTLSWDDVDGTWDDFTGAVALDEFDAGVYQLTALGTADGGYSALSIAQEAAASGGGVLYETRFGQVAYADASRRALTFAAGDFAEVPGGVLDLDGMQASSSLSELANRVLVEWDAGVVQSDIPESIIQFGLFVRKLTTILASETAAQARADEAAQNLSLPVFKADQFRLLLNNVSAGLLDRLVIVEPNDGVDFVSLPAALGFTRLTAFVEGVEWRIDPFTVELGMFASDERLSVGGVWWGRVTDTLEWGDVDAGLEWQQVGRTL